MTDAINITDNMIATLTAGMVAVRQLQDRVQKLEELLSSVRDEIEGYVDVADGPPGYESNVRPNWAMALTTEIDELIGKD